MRISIIIPNYNGEALLKKNLPKVIEAAGEYKSGEIEIIVVDDCSTDSSLDQIENARLPDGQEKLKIKNDNVRLRIIENDRNVGFASTVNRGVKEARGEIVVLLNTDVSPEKEFLWPLLKHFEDQKVFAVGCLDKSIENEKIVLRGRGVGRWRRGFLIHSRGEIDKANTLWVSGGSGAFRRLMWETLGGFDKIYNPFYWEDIDLSYRALKSGFSMLFEPKSVVIHAHQEGSIQRQFRESSIKRIAYRNQFFFAWLNLTDVDLILSHLYWLPYHIVRAFLHIDIPFLLGFCSAFIKIPQVFLKRKKRIRLFSKTDKEVVMDF